MFAEFTKLQRTILTAMCAIEGADLKEQMKIRELFHDTYYRIKAVYTDLFDGTPAQVTASEDSDFIYLLLLKFIEKQITVQFFNISTIENQEKYFDFLSHMVENHAELYTIFFANHKLYEHILLEINDRNFIRRNLIYIFNWGIKKLNRFFIRNIQYSMKVYVITNPKKDTQGAAHREHHLEKINWWKRGSGLFNHPTLPKSKSIYKDFKGKTFLIPVLHKPPWHFVEFKNNSNSSGNLIVKGRDHRILTLMSKKLNFRYKYFDPPERIQGTSENGIFNGVLGLISNREAEFFIGDVALTYERSNFVEFSFITLADSGAFVTHAPSRLNEALALLRPFHWQVWPAIGVTFLVVGPVLYALVALPNNWHPRMRVRSHARLFFDCTWFTITILFKQTGREPSSSHKARFFIILLSISATYVINDMYSANLTSLLARPGREKAINNLEQLETAMITRGYKLYVERHSSSYGLLENGTGIYGRLWDMVNQNQREYLIESVEDGVKLVRDTMANNIALLAGRETLFFDIQRFGASNFHLSAKLNTAYSAIAFQLGCPYIEEINKILMSIFEAGIITRMTENEYEELGKQKKIVVENSGATEGIKKENRRTAKAHEDNEKLKPITLKMLQGTFYLLGIGSVTSGVILLCEIFFHKHHRAYRKAKKKHFQFLKQYALRLKRLVRRIWEIVKRFFRNLMQDAVIATLEYVD